MGKICLEKQWYKSNRPKNNGGVFSLQKWIFYEINHLFNVLQFWILSKTLDIGDCFRKGFKRSYLRRYNIVCPLLSSFDFRPNLLWKQKYFLSLWSKLLNETVSVRRRIREFLFSSNPLIRSWHPTSQEIRII